MSYNLLTLAERGKGGGKSRALSLNFLLTHSLGLLEDLVPYTVYHHDNQGLISYQHPPM